MDFTGSIINELKSLPSFWWLWLIVVALAIWLIDGRKITPKPLLAAYVLFILFETVIGRKSGVGRIELMPFWSFSHPELRIEIILNYILFIPLGLLLYLSLGERLGLKVVLIGFMLSTLIEVTQLIFQIGLFEFDDIFGNTMGCLIGTLVGKMCLVRINYKNEKYGDEQL